MSARGHAVPARVAGALFVTLCLLRPAAGAEPAPCAARDAAGLLLDFFGPSASAASEDGQQLARKRAEAQGLGIEHLLATVPEPSLGLDGAVAALTAALQSAG